MNAQHSMATPVRCVISAIGRMSASEGPRRAVGGDPQPCIRDLAGQTLDVMHHVRPRAGEADVGRVDAETVDRDAGS